MFLSQLFLIMTDIYVNLLLTNSVQTHSNQRVPLNFVQNQSQPILKSTNGYELSIIRFSLNTETLPVFIPVMQSTTSTIYSVTMEANGQQYQQFMQFEAQNLAPADPDEHYYIYTYHFLIYLMNKCFASCLAGLSGLTTCPTNITPKLTFDPVSQKCTLTVNSSYGYNESNKINIYLNNSMYALLASLPACMINTHLVWTINLIIKFLSHLLISYKTIQLLLCGILFHQ